MELSVVGGGGATGAGQKVLRASTKPGDVVTALGKDGAARLARCGVEAGERVAGVRVGSGAKPVGLFLGTAGAVCL